jgi:hypothetical protein
VGLPLGDVVGVDREAEKICGDEAGLRGTDPDDADDGAVGGSDDPSVPTTATDEDRREDGEYARDVVETEHCFFRIALIQQLWNQ